MKIPGLTEILSRTQRMLELLERIAVALDKLVELESRDQ